MTDAGNIYGLVAEFDDPTALVQAARATRDYGFHRFEAYSPYPIKDLDEIIKSHNSCGAYRFGRRPARSSDCVDHGVLHRGYRLPDQRGWPSSV